VQQDNIQSVQVANFFGHFIADNRRRLGIILREHFSNFDYPRQIVGIGCFVLQGFRIKHMDT